MLLHRPLSNSGADTAACEHCASVWGDRRGTPHYAGGENRPCARASLPLQFQLSVSRALRSRLCLSNVPDCQSHPGNRSCLYFTPLELWEQ